MEVIHTDRNEKSGGVRSVFFSYIRSLIDIGIRFFIICGIIFIVCLLAQGWTVGDIFGNPIFHGKSYRMAFEMNEALEKRDTGRVKALIRKDPAYAKSKGEDGSILLHEISYRIIPPRERIEIMEMLLERGADVNAQDIYGNTPLHHVWGPDIDAAVKLLIDNGARVDIRDNEGDTALHNIAGTGNVDSVRLLLSKRADINARNNSQATPFLSAAGHGSPAVLKLLIDNGARIDIKDDKGNTPLHNIACTDNIDFARLLL